MLDNDVIDFEGFDNENGVNRTIVPNIVHLIYFNQVEMKFYQMINIFSIYLNSKPDYIYIHCDNCSFHGKYWQQLNQVKQIKQLLRIHKLNNGLDTIFGKQYGFIQHKSDVFRILILMNYGGIYLENDIYVVKSLDNYRRYEMACSLE